MAKQPQQQRYTIHEQLGAGGNGAVFRAYDTQLKRWVAAKRLLSADEAKSADPNVEELRREADTLASLRNPNIVTIFDVASDKTGLFMVMELLEGPDLADTVAHGPLMYEDFKQLAEQTLEALLAAHGLRILHRDIKPENIKVERLPGGRLQSKLIDFGLARTGVAARKQTEDQEGSVMGSIYYMAPEQLSREPIDVRTDLYSLGCVFYEALSGRKPFDGRSVSEVIDKHLDHDVLPLNQISPHLPQWLTYWVMRLMACKPEERPQTSQQAIEEFRAWEKLPPAPGMATWMPQGYGYAQPMHYSQPVQLPHYTGQVPVYTGQVPVYTGQVPVHTTGHVPVPAHTTGHVPVAPTPASAPVPVARQPSAPRGPQKPGAAPVKAVAKSKPPSKAKLYIGIGAAAAVLGLGFVLMGGKKDVGKGGGATSQASVINLGEAPENLYPGDRPFPFPEPLRVLHCVGSSAVHGFNGNSPATGYLNNDGSVAVWEDLSKRGGNNALVPIDLKPDLAPQRRKWTTPGNAIRDNRFALSFAARNGKAPRMAYTATGDAKAKFPFGPTGNAGSGPGLTLAVAFQVPTESLPCRIASLRGDDGQSEVHFQVNADRTFVAELRSATGGQATVKVSEVDATQPSIAILTWDGETGAIQLRGQDQRGVSKNSTANATAPTAPLTQLTIGGSSPGGKDFTGTLAEVLIFSTAQRDDQAASLGKNWREYYWNTPNGEALLPQKNKLLADWPIGEARSIFNGRDLSEWQCNSGFWKVVDGCIEHRAHPEANSSGQASALWKGGTVGDFELTAQCSFKDGNAGFFYRIRMPGLTAGGPNLQGYQFDFEADSTKRYRMGGLYENNQRGEIGKCGDRLIIGDHSDVKKANLRPEPNALGTPAELLTGFKPGEWFKLRVRAEGDKVQHFINDKLVLEAKDEGHGRFKSGGIGIEGQIKGKVSLRVKDIMLTRLR